ncbi:branched-chain amino acid ABC transporter permease [Haloarchaeobius sp. TZWWS8]|uniref:branched-chain amino acid ABC transporter permease n=1 Tax=Haloarchaeobius sp. TZWWS8 TaxID=3446121 RepID=UPI003EBD2F88
MMVLAVMVSLYAVYIVTGLVLGYPLRGQLNSIGTLTTWIALFAMFSLALNLQWGYTGLFNIGIIGFAGVGIYTMAIVSNSFSAPSSGQVGGFGLPWVVGIVAGVAVATAFGFIVALPALRLRADYLAIVTIAFSEIMRFAFLSGDFEVITLGKYGILPAQNIGLGGGSGIIYDFPSPMDALVGGLGLSSFYGGLVHWFGNDLPGLFGAAAIENPKPIVDQLVYGFLLLAGVYGFYWLLKRTGESPFGRVLKAIREDEDVARALGKDTDRFKIQAFMIGCGLMGLVGILWLWGQGTVTPTNIRPRMTFFIWIALILGGSGSNTGSILGGAVFAGTLFQGPLYLKNVLNQVLPIQNAPATFGQAGGEVINGLDPVPMIAYIFANIRQLQLVIMGIVLILVMIYRPQGMLGHRTETAASISLDRPRLRRSAGNDGGESDE